MVDIFQEGMTKGHPDCSGSSFKTPLFLHTFLVSPLTPHYAAHPALHLNPSLLVFSDQLKSEWLISISEWVSQDWRTHARTQREHATLHQKQYFTTAAVCVCMCVLNDPEIGWKRDLRSLGVRNTRPDQNYPSLRNKGFTSHSGSDVGWFLNHIVVSSC